MTEIFKQALEQTTFIKATPDEVFDVITSADGWNAFFTTGLEIDPRPGGKMWFRWKDWGPNFYTTECPCEVVEIEKPNKFIFKWGESMVSTVEFHLEAKFGGTVLTIKEHGYPVTDKGIESFLSCACGWGEASALLKFYIEHGIVYTPPEK